MTLVRIANNSDRIITPSKLMTATALLCPGNSAFPAAGLTNAPAPGPANGAAGLGAAWNWGLAGAAGRAGGGLAAAVNVVLQPGQRTDVPPALSATTRRILQEGQ